MELEFQTEKKQNTHCVNILFKFIFLIYIKGSNYYRQEFNLMIIRT